MEHIEDVLLLQKLIYINDEGHFEELDINPIPPDLIDRVSHIENLFSDYKPIHINNEGNLEEIDIWNVIMNPGDPLEARITRLEDIIKDKPIHINPSGEIEETDFNNPPLPPP